MQRSFRPSSALAGAQQARGPRRRSGGLWRWTTRRPWCRPAQRLRLRRVEDYARSLGYSARTLTRATLASDGVTAKEFIDRRILLEAKRLLAHSEQSAAHIAVQLGFSSATNFSKFFHRHTGKSPLTFRREIRGSQD